MTTKNKQALTLAAPASGEPLSLSSLRLLRIPEVIERTGYRKSELYRLMKEARFPKPVKLGERCSAWPEHEVSQWIADRIAVRDAKARAA